jgi:(2Fe-2S) ferredoxin
MDERLLFAVAVLFAGCAWQPVIHSYPSGLKVLRVDQDTLDKICSHTSDAGEPIAHAAGCYDRKNDMIYILNSDQGARALLHELAHREGVAQPSKAGYDW